ncbi:MAG: hypothetical protein IJP07_07560 [Firmicutes bacterium]|nr:hypothetical protein [Bacillota bacterium]
MAKLEQELTGDFDRILQKILNELTGGRNSASLAGRQDFRSPGARCSHLVFERYSLRASSCLSLSLCLFEAEGKLRLSAIVSGSDEMPSLLSGWAEDSFLGRLKKALEE